MRSIKLGFFLFLIGSFLTTSSFANIPPFPPLPQEDLIRSAEQALAEKKCIPGGTFIMYPFYSGCGAIIVGTVFYLLSKLTSETVPTVPAVIGGGLLGVYLGGQKVYKTLAEIQKKCETDLQKSFDGQSRAVWERHLIRTIEVFPMINGTLDDGVEYHLLREKVGENSIDIYNTEVKDLNLEFLMLFKRWYRRTHQEAKFVVSAEGQSSLFEPSSSATHALVLLDEEADKIFKTFAPETIAVATAILEQKGL
jgi:xanthosine utilization system XapX-like protein